jgi:hypothetical protein
MNRSTLHIGIAFVSTLGLGPACVQGGGSDGADVSTGGGEPPCLEQLPDFPPAGNPDFVGTVSAEAVPGVKISRVVSANIARTANDTTCCQDFVLSGGTNQVRIKFAAPYKGLTFLADRADELVSIGGASTRVLDLAVADLNGDNRNDIAVLRSDKVVVVAFAVPAPPPNGPYFAGTSSVTMANGGFVAGSSLDLADMDGDGDLDVFVTSTSTRILWRKNNGNGTFAAASNSNAQISTQNVVMARVDAGKPADALVSGSDGQVAYLRSTGNGFAAAQLHRVFPMGASTPEMRIAAGPLCPGHPTSTAVAVGMFDIVKIACSDGAGAFADVLEPHGTQEDFGGSVVDYVWDRSEGLQSDQVIRDLAVWTPDVGTAELYVLSENGDTRIDWYIPGSCGFKTGPFIPITVSGSTGFQSLAGRGESPDCRDRGDAFRSARRPADVARA